MCCRISICLLRGYQHLSNVLSQAPTILLGAYSRRSYLVFSRYSLIVSLGIRQRYFLCSGVKGCLLTFPDIVHHSGSIFCCLLSCHFSFRDLCGNRFPEFTTPQGMLDFELVRYLLLTSGLVLANCPHRSG